MHELVDHVGNRIRYRRAELGFSQAQLAEAAQIAPAQLYRYESGRNAPRPEILGRIAAALGVSVEWLEHGDMSVRRELPSGGALPSIKEPPVDAIELPQDILRMVAQRARRNKRSIEMEVIAVLEEAMAAERTSINPRIVRPSTKKKSEPSDK